MDRCEMCEEKERGLKDKAVYISSLLLCNKLCPKLIELWSNEWVLF